MARPARKTPVSPTMSPTVLPAPQWLTPGTGLAFRTADAEKYRVA